MPSAKVTSKGQLTLPKAVRDALGVDAGDHVHFLVREDGVVEVTARTRKLASLAGMLTSSIRGVSVEEMDVGLAAAVREELER
jgi:antitoxin PrlF